jgi:hypothetical protein
LTTAPLYNMAGYRKEHTVAYDRLTPSHPPLQLVKPHNVLVAALRKLTPAEAGTNSST